MALAIVRLGDKTTHGGVVTSASPIHTMRGIGIARMGDMVACPLPGHGSNPIIEGSSVFSIGGRKVALRPCDDKPCLPIRLGRAIYGR